MKKEALHFPLLYYEDRDRDFPVLFSHSKPQKLHSRPNGPLRHCGVFVVPHWLHFQGAFELRVWDLVTSGERVLVGSPACDVDNVRESCGGRRSSVCPLSSE